MRLYRQDYHDIERIIEFDFVRATESAALNALPWLGRGEKEKADAAACDALRGMFDLMNICGEVVIGEGIKDDAPGIFKGEQLGTWMPGSPQFDIALDPIDGTTNMSKGAPNSISCIAAASPEEGVKAALRDIPSFYMTKLAYGPRVLQHILDIEAQFAQDHIPGRRGAEAIQPDHVAGRANVPLPALADTGLYGQACGDRCGQHQLAISRILFVKQFKTRH